MIVILLGLVDILAAIFLYLKYGFNNEVVALIILILLIKGIFSVKSIFS